MSSDNLDIVKALVKLEKQTNELDKSICKYKDKEIKRLQQRIDKAIEYNDYFKKSTEEQKELGQDNSFIVSSYLGVFHDMMNDILRGEDNE